VESKVLFKLAKRTGKIVAGFALLVAGLIMLVTPGPGWITIALGLALLSSEFKWARYLLDRLKEKGIQIRDAVRKPKG
jgi:uncharacterized protein (TIGR02611 family)